MIRFIVWPTGPGQFMFYDLETRMRLRHTNKEQIFTAPQPSLQNNKEAISAHRFLSIPFCIPALTCLSSSENVELHMRALYSQPKMKRGKDEQLSETVQHVECFLGQ